MNACILCNRPIENNLSLSFLFSYRKMEKSLLCMKCMNKFEKINPNKVCPGCFRQQNNNDHCEDCKRWKKQYPKISLNHTALFTYNEIARDYMEQYKFQGDLLLANMFSTPIYQALNKYQKSHLIIPIPLNFLSQQKRGFNQVEILLKQANIIYQPLLENIRQEAAQSSKNRLDRLKTPQPFQLINVDELRESSKNKILLIDDVYTTGRTILHARRLLEKTLPTNFEIASFSLFR